MTKGEVPNIVALEVLKKNGVNIEKLKELITKGVGAEFTTYYYYTILVCTVQDLKEKA